MNKPNLNLRMSTEFLLIACVVAGCGGAKVLKVPQPIAKTQALASVSDHHVTATLDWIIVRDGPGTWAKNAFWDEYLLRFSNESDQPVRLMELIIVDSLDTRISAHHGRKQLVKGSKQTVRRYKESGMTVTAASGQLYGTAAIAMTTGAVLGAMSGGAFVGAGTAVAAGAVLVAAPVLAVGGLVRGVNNGAVNTQIEERQTILPLDVPAGDELALDVFFPLGPSPQTVELTYTDATGEYLIVLHTSAVLNGLHIESSDK